MNLSSKVLRLSLLNISKRDFSSEGRRWVMKRHFKGMPIRWQNTLPALNQLCSGRISTLCPSHFQPLKKGRSSSSRCHHNPDPYKHISHNQHAININRIFFYLKLICLLPWIKYNDLLAMKVILFGCPNIMSKVILRLPKFSRGNIYLGSFCKSLSLKCQLRQLLTVCTSKW